jgi:hypothetical protein
MTLADGPWRVLLTETLTREEYSSSVAPRRVR